MSNEIQLIDQSMLTCVSGGEDDHHWEDIRVDAGFIEFDLGQLTDLGSDLGIWLYDFFNS